MALFINWDFSSLFFFFLFFCWVVFMEIKKKKQYSLIYIYIYLQYIYIGQEKSNVFFLPHMNVISESTHLKHDWPSVLCWKTGRSSH